MLFDTHTHLDQPEFDADRGDAITRAATAGIETMVAVGTTAASSRICVDLADQFASVQAAVGIQPNYVADAAAGDWETVVKLAERPGVVALGETGLDRYWDFAPFDLQQDYFERHLELSRQRGLPVIVHMRDTAAETLDMLRAAHRHGPLRGVMHSFTGTPAMAEQCLAMGLYISFAGMVTFKKSTALRDCAAGIPADRIVIETDSPYLSPHPVRSQRRNEPANLLHTARCLAEVRGLPLEAFSAQTTANARRLFGSGPDPRGRSNS
jgi:TatD DNase family protein